MEVLLIGIGFVLVVVLTVPWWGGAIYAYWNWCEDKKDEWKRKREKSHLT